MSDTDEEIQLPADTLAILQNFLTEKSQHDENWQMSQFWYNEETVESLTNAVINLKTSDAKIALLSCPTLLPTFLEKGVDAVLFEFDQRFEKFGEKFQFYDYNFPVNIDERFRGVFQIIVADPPFLSDHCLSEFLKTVDFLRKESANIIFCTGAVMEDFLKRHGLFICDFVPEHKKKLGNVFRCFTNFGELDCSESEYKR